MKEFVRKTSLTFGCFCIVNLVLLLAHFWAFCAGAFNDAGVIYDTIIGAIPGLLICVAPLVIGSIIGAILIKKRLKDFVLPEFVVLQSLVVLSWSLFFLDCYGIHLR